MPNCHATCPKLTEHCENTTSRQKIKLQSVEENVKNEKRFLFTLNTKSTEKIFSKKPKAESKNGCITKTLIRPADVPSASLSKTNK